MLSPRIIHFTRSQVFWDCSTISACETLPDGLPFAISARATTDRRWRSRLQRKDSNQVATSKVTVEDSLETFWKTAVLNYTACDLTNQTDKMRAIWSVAKLVRDSLDSDQYGCGLWSKALHEQLAWQVKAVKPGARMDVLQSVFPSWSWASVNAPIEVQDRVVERCYTITNHDGERVSFSDFKGNALELDKQPEFEASDSLAVCGHLLTGRVEQNADGTTTFEYSTVTEPRDFISLNVTLDEMPTNVKSRQSYALPLAVREMNDEGITYSGSALVLISTQDFGSLATTKLKKLGDSYRLKFPKDVASGEQETERKMLKSQIEALETSLARLTKQDLDFPSRKGRCFRRIGVIHFDNLTMDHWASIRVTEQEMIWLN